MMVTSSNLRCIMLIALLLPALASQADWKIESEHWYSVELGDTKVGWMSMTHEVNGDQHRLSSTQHLSVNRGNQLVSITMSTSSIETEQGRPVQVSSVQEMSQNRMESQWDFDGEIVRQTTRQGGRETVREIAPPEGEWLMPYAAQRYVHNRSQAGAAEITYRTIDPTDGLHPMTMTHTRRGEGTFDHDGRSIPVSIWDVANDLLPLPSVEHVTSDGVMVYQEMATHIGSFIIKLSTPEAAKNEEVGLLPDLLSGTFIKPSQAIEHVERAEAATLRLRASKGAMPDLPTAGSQRVTPGKSEAEVVLKVNMHEHVPATAAELEDTSYLESSVMVDTEDDLIRKLAARGVRRVGDDPMARADALRTFVHGFVSRKNLGTAFASASETARTRAGDCSEHGVLLCALLRANGIPARVATGLVYVESFGPAENVFGWHMWTQALIDGRWVDLDATLNQRYHAGHVLVGTSSLGVGSGAADMSATLMLMGNLEIDVMDITYTGD